MKKEKKRKADPDIVLTMRIPASLRTELALVAMREDRTQAAVVRLAIRDYLDRRNK